MIRWAVIAALATVGSSPPSVDEGRHVFERHCASCHGELGGGDGPTASQLPVAPRDLTRGEFRWRTTPSGSLPTDDDLVRTVRDGIRGTWMSGWSGWLNERELRSVVAFVKTLSARFAEEEPELPMAMPKPPTPTPETIARGRLVYEKMQCAKCHGEEGRGDGPAALTLEDNMGRPIEAYDFTVGFFKGGDSAQAIYRTYMTGLDGTPMPSYAEAVAPEDRWPLVHYTQSLGRARGGAGWLFDPLEETR